MIDKFPIVRVTEQGMSQDEDIITTEFALTIILNNQDLVTLLCSPADLKYLAIGFLASEGLVKSKDEIKKIVVDDQTGVIRVDTEEDKGLESQLLSRRLITSGGGRGASFYSTADVRNQTRVESQITISAPQVFALVNQFQHHSQVYKATGGVHSAALCDTKNILAFSEDIGRHNAIDKIFGECILTDLPTEDRLIITSGRISSEILLKVARRNIPILISKSAPTDLGLKLAADLGITLIGFARGKRMNVYTDSWRVITEE